MTKAERNKLKAAIRRFRTKLKGYFDTGELAKFLGVDPAAVRAQRRFRNIISATDYGTPARYSFTEIEKYLCAPQAKRGRRRTMPKVK